MRIPKLVRDESGQAMTEWILIVAIFSVVMIGALSTFPKLAGDYYSRVAAFLMLPLP